jgi:hypothetical protein
MHSYHDTHGRLPPAVVYGANGKPLYSWRVLILPFIEQDGLYKEFHLDEPWDSPHNLPLLDRMPPVFNPFRKDASSPRGLTYYQVFTGKGAAFEGTDGLRLPEDFPDGPSDTLLIVEAAVPVPWTRPDDLPYAPDRPLPQLGGISRDQTFRAVLADGSVRSVNKAISEAMLRAAITRNGGEQLGPDW